MRSSEILHGINTVAIFTYNLFFVILILPWLKLAAALADE